MVISRPLCRKRKYRFASVKQFNAVLAALCIGLSFAKADSKIAAPRKEDLIYAPRPEYPYQARLHFTQGRGSFILHVRPNGTVASVEIEGSTGAPLLDRIAVAAYSKWRFKSGRVAAVRIATTFTMQPYFPPR